MNPPSLPDSVPFTKKKTVRGFFPPAIIKTVSFSIISLCILAGVVVCILAIWDFAGRDTLWRFTSSFLVVAAGTLLFSVVNGMFGRDVDS